MSCTPPSAGRALPPTSRTESERWDCEASREATTADCKCAYEGIGRNLPEATPIGGSPVSSAEWPTTVESGGGHVIHRASGAGLHQCLDIDVPTRGTQSGTTEWTGFHTGSVFFGRTTPIPRWTALQAFAATQVQPGNRRRPPCAWYGALYQ